MRIIFDLNNHGWANGAVLLNDHKVCDYSVSYLQDALGNLANATVNLINGSDKEIFLWWAEPGEYFWTIESKKEIVNIHVKYYPDWSADPEENGNYINNNESKVLLNIDLTLKEFVDSVFNCLNDVLEKYGVEEYKKRWVDDDFPLKEYEMIKKYLER